jgi:hypothetical protein
MGRLWLQCGVLRVPLTDKQAAGRCLRAVDMRLAACGEAQRLVACTVSGAVVCAAGGGQVPALSPASLRRRAKREARALIYLIEHFRKWQG